MYPDENIYTQEPPASINIEHIKGLFSGNVPSVLGQFASYVQNGTALQWGGLSDPFDIFEKKYGIGLQVLQMLYELRYPVCFSTKGVWWLDDDRYATLFRGNDFWNVKFSIINMDKDRAALMERGVPSPEDRLRAIYRLSGGDTGPGGKGLLGGVTLRLRPFIIGFSDVNEEYIDLIESAIDCGATAISTEFFCMEGRMTKESRERFEAMSEICDMDLINFYKRNSTARNGYMRLSPKVKQPYIDKMQAICQRRKVRFYVSDAHHKDRCSNGCCCGLPPEWPYSRGQFTEALMIAKSKGKVFFSEIEQEMPDIWMKQKVVTATCMNVARGTPQDRARFRNLTIKDYVRYIWNNPKQSRSPYKYFHGLLHPIGIDERNDVIYEYRPYKI